LQGLGSAKTQSPTAAAMSFARPSAPSEGVAASTTASASKAAARQLHMGHVQ
jgi:hypothetical protein